MYKGKTSTLFVRYALPQMLGLLLNSVYLIVDGIFIGIRLGRTSMAAAAIAVPVIEVLIAISLAVSSGAGVLISGRLGSGEAKQANNLFNLAVAVLAAIAAGIVILGNLFLEPLAVLLGSTPEIHEQAITYLWYIVSFSPFLLFSFLLSGLVRCDNRPRLAMIALTVGSLSNILLDYVFMYPLDMGIAGAALATALGPIFSVLILLPHFLRKKGCLHFNRFPWCGAAVRQMLTLGFPAFIMEFSIGIVTFIYNFVIIRNGYGEMGLAAYLIIGYIALIVLTLFLGVAQGLQPLFSFFQGAGEPQRGAALLGFSMKTVLCAGLASYGLILLLAQSFIAVFAPGDTELVRFTYDKSVLYFFGVLFAGCNILLISYWQSQGQTGRALLVSLLRSVLVLPVLVAVLPMLWGRETVWICFSLAEAVTACIAWRLYRSRPAVPPLEQTAGN